MTEIVHKVSPSQINDSIQCLRRWAWPKLDGIKPQQHRSAANGEGGFPAGLSE